MPVQSVTREVREDVDTSERPTTSQSSGTSDAELVGAYRTILRCLGEQRGAILQETPLRAAKALRIVVSLLALD